MIHRLCSVYTCINWCSITASSALNQSTKSLCKTLQYSCGVCLTIFSRHCFHYSTFLLYSLNYWFIHFQPSFCVCSWRSFKRISSYTHSHTLCDLCMCHLATCTVLSWMFLSCDKYLWSDVKLWDVMTPELNTLDITAVKFDALNIQPRKRVNC